MLILAPWTKTMLRRRTGFRQRIWDALLLTTEPIKIPALASITGANRGTVRVYLNGLVKHGYLVKDNGWMLVQGKNTGELAPAYSAKTGLLRDWNTDPVLSGAELETIWLASGLSIGKWSQSIGLSRGLSSRIKQMMLEQIVVTPKIEAAARLADKQH